MVALKKNDFIEVEYTGRIAEDNSVFDTTDEKTAKEAGIFSERARYGPVTVSLGHGHLLKGLDEYITGKEPGKYNVKVSAEDSFGRKSAKLLKLIPQKVFAKEKIRPFPGLEVEVDGTRGIVRSVSGGRIIVDFNHPLSGKDLVYDFTIKRVITDVVEKAKAMFRIELSFLPVDFLYDAEKSKLTVISQLPSELHKDLGDRIRSMIPEAKEIEFKAEKKAEQKDAEVKSHPEAKAEEKPASKDKPAKDKKE